MGKVMSGGLHLTLHQPYSRKLPVASLDTTDILEIPSQKTELKKVSDLNKRTDKEAH